ncbi:hypothetical protein WJX79_004094 [Trebouxia sp. C0005]
MSAELTSLVKVARMAIEIAETTYQPPSVPLRRPIFMSLPAKKTSLPQEIEQAQETCCAFLQLGPPGPLQLMFIRAGRCLFKVDLIRVPSPLPIYISIACRDNGLRQEQVDMRSWAISPAAPDLKVSKAAAMAVVLWTLVMQQAMRGVDYMAGGARGHLRCLLRITMNPSKPGLGYMPARATLVEVPALPRLLSDPIQAPASKIAKGKAQAPTQKQPNVSHIKLSAARSQREDAQEHSNSSEQIRQEIEACIRPLLLQQESRFTAKIDALSHKLDAFLQLFSSSQVSKGTLSVATQTSGFDARPAGKGPAALALLSLKQRMSARDGAAPAEACFIPAGYGMEAAGPPAEGQAAPADHSKAEAEGGALRCEANMTATALKTKADASALEEPEDPALVAAPSRQREQCQPQSEKAEPANSELSGGDSLDSLLGDLPPFPTDDPVSFWQSSGSSIWEEAHNLAAQTLEADANSREGQMETLDLEEQRDLVAVGGSDAQAMYNVAVMHAVNNEVVAAQQRPAPILQQPRPLRRPPTTPNEVAHSVHGKVVQMTQLAAAPMHDMHKFQAMLHHDATEASASIDRGTASVEAQLKMQLADSIFDDLT